MAGSGDPMVGSGDLDLETSDGDIGSGDGHDDIHGTHPGHAQDDAW